MALSIQDLNKSEAMILKTLMLNGPLTIPGIAARSELKKSTVYEALHGKPKFRESSLLNGNLVKIIETKLWKSKAPMSTYALTLQGLSVSLINLDELWKDIDNIVERWKNLLPFFFRRWNSFKEYGVAEEAKEGLKSSLWSLVSDKYGPTYSDEEYETLCINEWFACWLATIPLISETKMKWDKLLLVDHELREKVKKYLVYVIADYKGKVEMARISLEVIEKIEESEPNWDEIRKMEWEAFKALDKFQPPIQAHSLKEDCARRRALGYEVTWGKSFPYEEDSLKKA